MPFNQIDEAVVRVLRQLMKDRVLAPGTAGYEAARQIWNGRFDRPGASKRLV
jgi:hypothetical protein